MKSVDIYDFDHTIYKGDCMIDFYLYSIRRKPMLLVYLPYQVWHIFLFKIRAESRTDMKSNFFIFLRGINDISGFVDDFWEKHINNIKPWFYDKDKERAVIISASPEFLLAPAAKKLKVNTLIATRLNPENGIISGENCRGEEKIRRFNETLPQTVVDEAYSDHDSDAPMLRIAKKSYKVKGNSRVLMKNFSQADQKALKHF